MLCLFGAILPGQIFVSTCGGGRMAVHRRTAETAPTDPGGKMPGPSGWLKRAGCRIGRLGRTSLYDARRPSLHPTPLEPTEWLQIDTTCSRNRRGSLNRIEMRCK